MPRIDPTAIVHPSAELAEDVEIGPWSHVEQDVRIGRGTVLREFAIIRRYTTLGEGNFVDAHCVLGGWPQDLKFDPNSVTYLRIGDHNMFREGVTISRATKPENATLVGNGTYWMTAAHAGHDSTVEDGVILVNGAAVAGHAVVHRRAILSAHAALHQFCWAGELVMAQGNATMTMHVPPYCMVSGVNTVIGLNAVGLRRASDLNDEDRQQIRDAFNLLYRGGLTMSKALERLDVLGSGWGPAADKFRQFVRRALEAPKPFNRGLCPFGRNRHGD